ncbi:MAG: hypothetical protein RIS35_3397 [Pseudomonadota bacterium]|jgi:stringent starvation protein B
MSETSTKPYLIRAIHEWCTDNGYKPYLAVAVDEHTVVPREFVRGGEIILNVSIDATNRLRLGNDLIEFEARFGGVARQLSVPVDNVTAIYAAESGHGLSFEVVKAPAVIEPAAESRDDDEAPGATRSPLSALESAAPGARPSPALVSDSQPPAPESPEPPPPTGGGRPRLTRVK